jgi:hypothetical protein
VEKGRRGRGHADRFTLRQAVAVAYGLQYLGACFDLATANRACEWVARQHLGKLAFEFARGRTVLLVGRDGRADLIEPAVPAQANRALRLLLSQLDLRKCYERTLGKASRAGIRLAGEERELAEWLASEEAATEKRTGRG